MIRVALLLLVTSSSAHAMSLEEDLEKVTYFSWGNDGFIAQQSEGKRLYEKILSSEKSENLFLKIINSASATNESKLYAACGLSIINKNRIDEFVMARGFVTVLQGDILRKENFAGRIAKIKEKGCEG
ncbi:hypothetical protein LQ939_16110 [Pantoea alhagi]|uniref:MchS3 family protein n=1 Tax=Pantoea alhagi TaxID=1891675 RepID=UPI00202B98ED|nr:MchS3 family protein [Pantoea alhagi]URQ60216.1 hypothetical protein LQ939_16110 [Pantoea alhagi]